MVDSSVRKYASKAKHLIEHHIATSMLFSHSFTVSFKDHYQYLPLNEAAQEIRLLTLLSGLFSSEIRVLLHITSFKDGNLPKYEALSYAWGSVECRSTIYVDASGKYKLPVTKNLEMALRYLRYEDRPRILWIDAICVNQQDLSERDHQVQCMSTIFTKAKRVVVWLGPAEDRTRLAMDLIEEIGSKIEVDWRFRSMKPVFEDGNEHHWGDMRHDTPLSDYQWDSLDAFFGRAWFGRLWVWQEIWLADQKAAIVQSGLNVVQWQDVKDTIFCLTWQTPSNFLVQRKVVQIYEIATRQSASLEMLARKTRHGKFSDDRDRIYALLSLVTNKIDIAPDYTKPTAHVFQEAALAILKQSKACELLVYCEMTQTETNMPSWVPDWCNQSPASPLRLHSASGSTQSDGFYIGNGIIVMKGVIRKKITRAVPLPSADKYNKLVEVVKNLAPIDFLNGGCISTGGTFDAYCRMLCGGAFKERFTPPEISYPSFKESREVLRDIINSQLDITGLTLAAKKYLAFIRNTLKRRTLLTTEDGFIGLGPSEAQINDQIGIILGCPTPLILRPNLNGQHQIVGSGYFDGLMAGEALLGLLPTSYEPIMQSSLRPSLLCTAYLNHQTGKIQTEDPRLGPLPEDWQTQSHENEKVVSWFYNKKTGEGKESPGAPDPRLTTQALKERGVNLVEIRLV